MMYPVAFFRCATDNTPVQKHFSWSEICALLKKRSIRESKDGPLFSPTLYQEGTTRANKNVESLSLLVLDVDSGVAPGPLMKRVGELGLACAIYSSYSCTPLHPKWRIVIPLAQPVPGEEWGTAWAQLVRHLGTTVDSSRSDQAGLYYLPACPQEQAGNAFFHVLEGAPLDYSVIREADSAHETTRKTCSNPETHGGASTPGLAISNEIFRQYADVIADYNERGDHFSLLTAAGWQLVESTPEERWRRPGKSEGHSATFGYGGNRIFNCFTSSAVPLQGRAFYRVFDLRCVLEFGGDVARCASFCRGEGYGNTEKPQEQEDAESFPHPADSDPEEESVSPDPLVKYLRYSDQKLADQRKRGVKRSRYTENEYALAAQFLPEEMIADSVREIYVGKTLRNREEAKTRDTIVQLGQWYDSLPNKHNARPYIVARAFGLPIPDPVIGPHVSVIQKMADLQSFVRIWKAFGQCEVDAPTRLYKTLASVKCPHRRQYWLDEWTHGRGGNVEGKGNIYDRIADEKREEKDRSQKHKNLIPITKTSGEIAENFDPETGAELNPQNLQEGETVMVAVSPLLQRLLQAFQVKAAEMGMTPEELMQQFLLTDLQKHYHDNVFEAETEPVPVENEAAIEAEDEWEDGSESSPVPSSEADIGKEMLQPYIALVKAAQRGELPDTGWPDGFPADMNAYVCKFASVLWHGQVTGERAIQVENLRRISYWWEHLGLEEHHAARQPAGVT